MLNQYRLMLGLSRQSELWKDHLRNGLLNIATKLAIPEKNRAGFKGYSGEGLASKTAETDRQFIANYSGNSGLIDVDLVKKLNAAMTELNSKYISVRNSLGDTPKDIKSELSSMNQLRSQVEAAARAVFTEVKQAVEGVFNSANNAITEPVKSVSNIIKSIEQKTNKLKHETMRGKRKLDSFTTLKGDADRFIYQLSNNLEKWYAESTEAYRKLLRA